MKLRRPGDALSCLQNKLLLHRVRALYDCDADREDELTFRTGEVIVVSDKEDSNWWVSEPVYADWRWDAHDPLSIHLSPLSRDCGTHCPLLLCICLSIFHLFLGNPEHHCAVLTAPFPSFLPTERVD